MNGKISIAVILAVAVQAIGLVWYVSKIDSKVEILYSQYQESSQEAVIENQVRMRIDLQNVVDGLVVTSTQIEQLTQMVEKVRKSNNQLVNQNNKIKNTNHLIKLILIKKRKLPKKMIKGNKNLCYKLCIYPIFLALSLNFFALYLKRIFFSFFIIPILDILTFNFLDRAIILDLFIELDVNII